MVYIPKRIQEKLEEISVYEVAEKLGVVISRNRALCFVHDDHHPSLYFKKSTNSWKCFACGAYGRNIEMVLQVRKCSFQEACVWLARQFHIDIPNTQYVKLKHIAVKHPKPIVKTESIVDEEVLDWIIRKAGLSILAKQFLFEERLYSEEVVGSLNIKSISNAKDFVNALLAVFPRERCLKAGVVIEVNGKILPVFRVPCLLFPYYGLDGKIKNIQSRYLGALKKDARCRFNNCKGLRPLMFNLPVLNPLAQEDKVYVAEGVTDCLALLSEGKKAIALPGAKSFQPEFAECLKNKTLFIYPDKDIPGEELCKDMNLQLEKHGNHIYSIRRDNQYKDYSEYYKAKLISKGHEKDSK